MSSISDGIPPVPPDVPIDLARWLEENLGLLKKQTQFLATSGNGTKLAKISAVGTANYTCRVLNQFGSEVGPTITVTPAIELGTADLDGAVWPNYAVGDTINVFEDVDGSWYTQNTTDDVQTTIDHGSDLVAASLLHNDHPQYLLINQSTPQTITASPIFDWLTASQALMTDASKKLISVDYLDQAVKIASTPTFGNITDSGLTATRVTYAGASGLLSDSANLTYDGTTLTVASNTAGPHLRLKYDVSKYSDIAISSTGRMIITSGDGQVQCKSTSGGAALAWYPSGNQGAQMAHDGSNASFYNYIGNLHFSMINTSGYIEFKTKASTGGPVYFKPRNTFSLVANHLGVRIQPGSSTAAANPLEVVGISRFGDGGTTNYAAFAADGELTLVGTARVIKELTISAAKISVGASGVVVDNRFPYIGYKFSIGDHMYASFEMPEDWDETTNIQILVYWYIDEARGGDTDAVTWSIPWKAVPHDETESIAAPTHTGTSTFSDHVIPVTALHLTRSIGSAIAVAGLAHGDIIGVDVTRVAGGGVSPVAEPAFLRLEIEYTSNKLGEAT